MKTSKIFNDKVFLQKSPIVGVRPSSKYTSESFIVNLGKPMDNRHDG